MIFERLGTWCWLLAQRSPLDSMGSGFRGRRARFETEDLLVGLMLLAGAAVAVYVLSRLVARQEREKPYHSPRAMFAELCKSHGLDRPSRRLLRRLARYRRLDRPSLLFLNPTYFDTAHLRGPLAAHRSAITRLRKVLFARPSEASEGRDAAPHAQGGS